jgi:hypothetical protein
MRENVALGKASSSPQLDRSLRQLQYVEWFAGVNDGGAVNYIIRRRVRFVGWRYDCVIFSSKHRS